MSEYRCIERVHAWCITGVSWLADDDMYGLKAEGRGVAYCHSFYEPRLGDWLVQHSDDSMRVLPVALFNRLYRPQWLDEGDTESVAVRRLRELREHPCVTGNCGHYVEHGECLDDLVKDVKR